jgi:hypothetical protein
LYLNSSVTAHFCQRINRLLRFGTRKEISDLISFFAARHIFIKALQSRQLQMWVKQCVYMNETKNGRTRTVALLTYVLTGQAAREKLPTLRRYRSEKGITKTRNAPYLLVLSVRL